jgi:hypothetical protein
MVDEALQGAGSFLDYLLRLIGQGLTSPAFAAAMLDETAAKCKWRSRAAPAARLTPRADASAAEVKAVIQEQRLVR